MIDQRFIEDLAQDLVVPKEPTPEMQLASANTGVTTDGGAFVGYRMNTPKGLNTPQNMGKQSVLIADTLAGGGKGAVQGFVGLPGDLESIGRMALGYLGYNVDENTVLPTSEEIGKKLESVLGPVIPPNQTTSVPTAERVRAAEGGTLGGEILAPGGQLAVAGKVAKPVIGATKKIIEAGKDLPVGMSIKGVDESLDSLGFYSAASKAVDNIAQEKGTGAQFLAQIEKTPGVKKEELLWTGLDDYLKGKKSVTKAEVQEFLNANRVEVKEVQLSDTYTPVPKEITANDITVTGGGDEMWTVTNPNGKSFQIGSRVVGTPEEAADYGANVFNRDAMDAYRESITSREGKTKFNKFTLPGGENYREIYLTLPSKVNEDQIAQEMYGVPFDKLMGRARADVVNKMSESRFIVPRAHSGGSTETDWNRLAQIRVNDRIDADGKKVLFVEEIQSDWHQAGRKKGYKSDLAPAIEEYKSLQKEWGNTPYSDLPGEVKSRLDELRPIVMNENVSVPDAPFKTSWHELALKRAIQLASEGGYDRIAFTTGKTQAERYDLSKQIENIQYNQKTKSLFGEDKNGRIVVDEIVEPERLDEYIGKEAANKLLSDESIIARTKDGKPFLHELSGQQLQIGGEGMKGFYDNILPKYLDKYGKKWDAKTGMTAINTGNQPSAKRWAVVIDADNNYRIQDTMTDRFAEPAKFATKEDALVEINKRVSGEPVHYMDITPKMKESVLTKGQPLFQMAPAIPAGMAAGQQEDNK